MQTEKYKGKTAIIKSSGREGIIKDVTARFNAEKVRTVRFIIDDANGKPVEYMPHEVEIVNQVVSEQ